MALRRPLRVLGNDEYALDLATDERTVLRRLCEELRPLVAGGDETVGRLFPAAYRDDPDASAGTTGWCGRASSPTASARSTPCWRPSIQSRLSLAEVEGVVRRPQRHPPRPR